MNHTSKWLAFGLCLMTLPPAILASEKFQIGGLISNQTDYTLVYKRTDLLSGQTTTAPKSIPAGQSAEFLYSAAAGSEMRTTATVHYELNNPDRTQVTINVDLRQGAKASKTSCTVSPAGFDCRYVKTKRECGVDSCYVNYDYTIRKKAMKATLGETSSWLDDCQRKCGDDRDCAACCQMRWTWQVDRCPGSCGFKTKSSCEEWAKSMCADKGSIPIKQVCISAMLLQCGMLFPACAQYCWKPLDKFDPKTGCRDEMMPTLPVR